MTEESPSHETVTGPPKVPFAGRPKFVSSLVIRLDEKASGALDIALVLARLHAKPRGLIRVALASSCIMLQGRGCKHHMFGVSVLGSLMPRVPRGPHQTLEAKTRRTLECLRPVDPH